MRWLADEVNEKPRKPRKVYAVTSLANWRKIKGKEERKQAIASGRQSVQMKEEN